MDDLLEVRHVTVSIRRSPRDVYEFAANAQNMPQWARGLGEKFTRDGENWIAEGPLGRVTVRFAPANPYGVLDHDVTLPGGQSVHNPLRVVPNGRGSEVTFSVFRLPDVSPEKFAEDTKAVERDLQALKAILERPLRS